MNHVLKLVANDRALQIASYGDPSLPLADELRKTLVSFLAKQLREPNAAAPAPQN